MTKKSRLRRMYLRHGLTEAFIREIFADASRCWRQMLTVRQFRKIVHNGRKFMRLAEVIGFRPLRTIRIENNKQ